MGWERETDESTGHVWTREDGLASITLRGTGTDQWAVTLDRLEQAPAGETYDRVTVDSRESALAVVDRWKEEYAAPDGE